MGLQKTGFLVEGLTGVTQSPHASGGQQRANDKGSSTSAQWAVQSLKKGDKVVAHPKFATDPDDKRAPPNFVAGLAKAQWASGMPNISLAAGIAVVVAFRSSGDEVFIDYEDCALFPAWQYFVSPYCASIWFPRHTLATTYLGQIIGSNVQGIGGVRNGSIGAH
jgi:hypothetical protein